MKRVVRSIFETQPSALPTNKLTVGAFGASAVAVHFDAAIREVWTSIAPTVLAGPETASFVSWSISAGIALLAGRYVPDLAGTPIIYEVDEPN